MILFTWYIMPPLAGNVVMPFYGISYPQFATALTLPFLAGAFFSIPGGLLADNIGIRKAASLGFAVASIGFLIRSISGGYMVLLSAMIIVGIGLGTLMPNLPKLVSIWFPPDETGMATGIYNTGMMGGMSTGMVLAPYLPGWSTANIMLGAVLLVLTAVFFGIVRDSPEGMELPPSNLVEGFKAAAHSRSVWGGAIALFLAMAGMVCFSSGLPEGIPLVYENIGGASAALVASMITYGGIIGSLALPTIGSKTGHRALILGVTPTIFLLIMMGSWHAGTLMILLAGAFIGGMIAGGIPPIVMEVPTFLPRIEDDPIEPQFVGGASGFLTTLMQIGGFAGFPIVTALVIGPMGWTAGFWVAGLIFASAGVGALIIQFPQKLE